MSRIKKVHIISISMYLLGNISWVLLLLTIMDKMNVQIPSKALLLGPILISIASAYMRFRIFATRDTLPENEKNSFGVKVFFGLIPLEIIFAFAMMYVFIFVA